MIIKFSGQMEVDDDKLAALVAGSPVAKSEPPSARGEAAEGKAPKRRKRKPTMASMRKKTAEIQELGLIDELKELLDEFKIRKITELEDDAEALAEFDGALDKIIAESGSE